ILISKEGGKNRMGIIDRNQAEEMAWQGYVGSQTPEEFLAISRGQGHDTTEAAVLSYVGTLEVGSTLFEKDDRWTFDDLPDLLLGYTQRYSPNEFQGEENGTNA